MKNRMLTIGMSVVCMSVFAPAAFAQSVPTMNQPDNGFFEAANPEWASLHSTSLLGTVEHRQYHRDAVQLLLQWLENNRSERGTSAYSTIHRSFLQERNLQHRLFHTPVVITTVVNP